MAALNDDLRSGGEVNAETARRMGLLVVSRLAKRHGIFVELERNTRGGVTASVVLPTVDPAAARPVAPAPAARPGARRAHLGARGLHRRRPEPPSRTDVAATRDRGGGRDRRRAGRPGRRDSCGAAAARRRSLGCGSRPRRRCPCASRPATPPAPAAGLAARLQSMREAREAANLGNAGTPGDALHAAAALRRGTPGGRRPPAPTTPDSIEAAINAVIRLPQRRPGPPTCPGDHAAAAAAPEPPSRWPTSPRLSSPRSPSSRGRRARGRRARGRRARGVGGAEPSRRRAAWSRPSSPIPTADDVVQRAGRRQPDARAAARGGLDLRLDEVQLVQRRGRRPALERQRGGLRLGGRRPGRRGDAAPGQRDGPAGPPPRQPDRARRRRARRARRWCATPRPSGPAWPRTPPASTAGAASPAVPKPPKP